MTKDIEKKVGVGIIGLGYWGPNLVRNFFRQGNCNLVALCDLDKSRIEKQLNIYPSVLGTTNSDEVISNKDIDVVVICTPPSSHCELAEKALRSGKHVYVAKPITLVPEEALHLAQVSEETGMLLHVDHTFIYTPAVKKLKEIVSNPDFGPINYIDSVRINLGLFQPDTNVVWDLAPHDLSIISYLLDSEPHTVVAHTNAPLVNKFEHLAYVSMHYDNGIIANVHLNWLSPVKVRRTIIGGTKKMIIYDDMEPTEKVRVFSSGVDIQSSDEDKHRDLVQYRIGDINSPFVENLEALDLECKEFLNAVIEGGKTPTSGLAGYNVVRLCEAIDKSMKAGGIPIEIQ